MTKSEPMPENGISKLPNKIAIDARMIRHSGIGRYIENLLNQFLELKNDEFQFQLFGSPDLLTKYTINKNFSVYPYFAPIYKIKEQVNYPKKYFRQYDLLHVPHYNIPISYSGKLVITVYDLIHYLFPKGISNPIGQRYARFLLKKAVSHAHRIITISQSTKNDLIKHLHVREDKIDVIYCGSPKYHSFASDPGKIHLILKKYSMHKPYILHVGIDKPHKNVIRLIQSFGIFLQKTKSDYQLVLLGPKEPLRQSFLKEIAKYQLESKVIVPGYISDTELAVFYKNAALFVFPSLYEGFGLPPLEAMAMDIPVISSNLSSLPETVGDAAFQINPYNTEEMADAMEKILTDSTLRQELIEKGKRQLTRFSWEKTAHDTLEVYRKVLQD